MNISRFVAVCNEELVIAEYVFEWPCLLCEVSHVRKKILHPDFECICLTENTIELLIESQNYCSSVPIIE